MFETILIVLIVFGAAMFALARLRRVGKGEASCGGCGCSAAAKNAAGSSCASAGGCSALDEDVRGKPEGRGEDQKA